MSRDRKETGVLVLSC